ncbi:integrase [Nitrosomonas oligotropha]|uniref:Integrase n=1 Tax=Nitrosomonas oligotropha TaxID=42354 RepID=A0A2T5HZ28_9PROT|nr:integrase arm-type DNA-binding domain-containing protein [Nitrosomonas oligotropha]PTQ76830.1 integrase [Nitrosomonas oligotropha]
MARHLIKTDVAIRNTKSTDATLRLSDGDGLYLLIKPNGAKWWRLDYSIGGKRKTLSIGVYPDTGLKAARNKADEARQLVAAGTDPSDVRKASKVQQAKVLEADKRIADGLPAVDSFEEVAREWFTKFSAEWAPSHADKIIRRLERDIFPWIGKRPIAEITAPELLAALRRIEERGAVETAHRAHQNCGQIFRYAIATGRAERDPSPDLRGALPSVKQTHHAAITDPKAIGELLRAIDGYQGYFVTKCALRIAPMVFVRPGELRKAEWAEIDLDKAEWNIPAGRMKMREPHLVPLSTQAVEVLRELHALTGDGRYVFPGARTNGRPMSDNAILAALRRMGFAKDEMSGHGFRAMARTILDEVLQVRPDFIEHQLAHAVRDPNGRAYNRIAHLAERRKIMQQWADYLDKLKAGADVIPLHKKA